MFKILFSFLFTFVSLAQAATWDQVEIPDAFCGNGSPYKVFVEKKSSKKLMVEFMGGGACWDFESCFALPHTIILPIPQLKSYSIFTSDDADENFLKDNSKVYFPYCTGDVYVGNYVADYALGTKVMHYGDRNVVKTLAYLHSKNIINFKNIDELVVWGASAGALGSMLHADKIGKLISPNAKKTMIIDSPGLHWGKAFWDKFPVEMKKGFHRAFAAVGANIKFDDGLIAKDIIPTLNYYHEWKIGFLLGTKDLVMSTVFGDISPSDQSNLILSKKGLPNLVESLPNVFVWVRDTRVHTFLLLPQSAGLTSFDGVTAIDFARSVYEAR